MASTTSAAPPAGAAKVIGYDAAGVVVEVGPQASLFRPGDEVFYQFLAEGWYVAATPIATSTRKERLSKRLVADDVLAQHVLELLVAETDLKAAIIILSASGLCSEIEHSSGTTALAINVRLQPSALNGPEGSAYQPLQPILGLSIQGVTASALPRLFR
jgi:hypothetical protein